jgi:hypothetical protein
MEKRVFRKIEINEPDSTPRDEIFQKKRPTLYGSRENVGIADILALQSKEPQMDESGRLRYLITGGWVVHLIANVHRAHNDVDLVVLDEKDDWYKKYGFDTVTPKNNWAELGLNREDLEQTAWITKIQIFNESWQVITVHPAIIAVQKLSNHLERSPRPVDLADVERLIAFWERSLNCDPSWGPVISKAIAGLPQAEQSRTTDRFFKYYPSVSKLLKVNF